MVALLLMRGDGRHSASNAAPTWTPTVLQNNPRAANPALPGRHAGSGCYPRWITQRNATAEAAPPLAAGERGQPTTGVVWGTLALVPMPGATPKTLTLTPPNRSNALDPTRTTADPYQHANTTISIISFGSGLTTGGLTP